MIKMKNGEPLTIKALQDAIDELRSLRDETWPISRIAKVYVDKTGCVYLVGENLNVGVGFCRGRGNNIQFAVAYKLGLACVCEALPGLCDFDDEKKCYFNLSDCEEIF